MKKLQSILESPWAISFGETILHSFWQGAIILAVYWLLIKKWKEPQAKVNLGLYALFSQIVASAITLFLVFSARIEFASGELPMLEIATAEFSISQWIAANSPYLFAAWLIGFTFLSIKYSFSLIYVQWLKRSHQNSLSSKASTAWHDLTKKVSIEGFKIQIFESNKVTTAMVLGHLKPIILIPVAMVNYLSVEQLEVVLAHELAHIKRNDFLVNLFQTLVESIYFFHPIYWFIGNQIRENRELACDSLAADWTGNGVLLAKTLATIQLSQSQPEFAMAFGKKKMPTLNRIESLLGYQNKNQKSKFFALLLMCSMIMAFGFVPKPNQEVIEESIITEVQAPLIVNEIETVVSPLDTGIVSRTVEQTINKEEVSIKTDNYDVNIDEDGIVLNGKKVEMSASEKEEFKKKWKSFKKSQKEIEEMSKAIEKESSKIEAIHKDFAFEIDPSDDPNFKEYVAAIEKSGEEIGELATKMTNEIMKLDRSDKAYNKKSAEITQAYSQQMQTLQKVMEEHQPKLEKWQAQMEIKQKEFEKKMQAGPMKEIEAKLETQSRAIGKVANRMENEHNSLLDLLPNEVKNEIENGQHIHMNYPPSPPAPPAPAAVPKPTVAPQPQSIPKPATPPAPPRPIKD
ncbi:Signal transducer regulating beta-lactamase production, contains metallopeptidase domain [Spirosomataceae bacterium TFI 002]|nr:Signal transducer regulating beta-lactamase production, contains metallopeptidase domain [Spirosomataceae bacterium TFI 002]